MDRQTKIKIVKCYFNCGDSATAAVRQFKKENHLHKTPFTPHTVQRIVNRFLQTGSVDDKPRSGRPSVNERDINSVRSAMYRISNDSVFGQCSVRNISTISDVAPSTVYKILRNKLSLYPYKLQMLHAIPETIFPQRTHFAQWLLSHEDVLPNILWSDEAYFKMDGEVNTHNCRIWAQERPRIIATTKMMPPKICVWIGITSNFRLQPYFFPGTVDGNEYLHMLMNHVRPSLTQMRKLSSTWLMQDGAPPHIHRKVKDFLLKEQNFKDRVISRHCAIGWPPYSPDLNPMDYFLWGRLKDKVYRNGSFETVEDLKEKIIEEFDSISQEEIRNAVHHILDRCLLLIQEGGKHFEQLL